MSVQTQLDYARQLTAQMRDAAARSGSELLDRDLTVRALEARVEHYRTLLAAAAGRRSVEPATNASQVRGTPSCACILSCVRAALALQARGC